MGTAHQHKKETGSFSKVLEERERVCRPPAPPFPGSRLAVSCGEVGQALTGVQFDS